MKKIAIVGGGAAGFFVAANLGKKIGQQTVLFEQANLPLQKVRISGGGRCNVTHACFDPLDLVEFYPRGKKELLSVQMEELERNVILIVKMNSIIFWDTGWKIMFIIN